MTDAAVLSKEIQQEQQRVNSAQTYLKLEQSRYESGIDLCLAVLVTQTTVLGDQQALNSLQVWRMIDAVALVEALGSGGIVRNCLALGRYPRSR